MQKTSKVLIIGAGVFGLTASIALQKRGYEVHLFERGKIPAPEASSTDISKIIRADYGADEQYTDMMLEAFKGWKQWNAEWERPLYHQTGFLLLKFKKMAPGSFEFESQKTLLSRGVKVETLTKALIEHRFPEWSSAPVVDGYYNANAGWAESSAVIRKLAAIAQREGVQLHEETRVMNLMSNNYAVGGLLTAEGLVYGGDIVIVAAGAWSGHFIPDLQDKINITGQPVYYFKPQQKYRYEGEQFPVWSADISETGWYGFPVQEDGLLKIAYHGEEEALNPNENNDIPPHVYPKLNTFLHNNLPQMEQAKIEKARLCYYCDTWDGNFYITPHPAKKNLIIACGGSGHGFKFAPILGDLIADVAEGQPNRFAAKFKWRARGVPEKEAARKR
jgi:glycine/D-amino acid oxidase-like deaminating enzyme